MNYEASPFQNYESITIDELKDQANSLLNLVTEEQRPLCVCMNNSKEFLLFPQDLLAPVCDSDFRLILLSAMRYAMGRNTCMPMVVADYIKRHMHRKSWMKTGIAINGSSSIFPITRLYSSQILSSASGVS